MLRLTHYTTCHACDGDMRPPGTSAKDHPGTLAYREGNECNTCASRRRRNNRDPHVQAMRASLETLPGPTDPEQVRHGAVASMTVEFYNQGPERLGEATAEVLLGQYVGNRKRNRHGLLNAA